MYEFYKHERKDFIKWIVTAILFVAIITALIVLTVKMSKSEKTTTLNFREYEIGSLSDTGEFTKSTESIVTKDYVTVKGLTVELKEDAKVQYRVFYYAKNSETGKMTFVSATELTDSDLAVNAIPETAQYAKILIVPTRDSGVSNNEVRDYANQVTVTHNK